MRARLVELVMMIRRSGKCPWALAPVLWVVLAASCVLSRIEWTHDAPEQFVQGSAHDAATSAAATTREDRWRWRMGGLANVGRNRGDLVEPSDGTDGGEDGDDVVALAEWTGMPSMSEVDAGLPAGGDRGTPC